MRECCKHHLLAAFQAVELVQGNCVHLQPATPTAVHVQPANPYKCPPAAYNPIDIVTPEPDHA
jgi:hypothetical protein